MMVDVMEKGTRAWETAILKRAVKKGLPMKVTFGPRLKGDE